MRVGADRVSDPAIYRRDGTLVEQPAASIVYAMRQALHAHRREGRPIIRFVVWEPLPSRPCSIPARRAGSLVPEFYIHNPDCGADGRIYGR